MPTDGLLHILEEKNPYAKLAIEQLNKKADLYLFDELCDI